MSKERPIHAAVLHYAEIGLKGGNRRHFEDILMRNVKSKLGLHMVGYRRESGQISVDLARVEGEEVSFEQPDFDFIADNLKRIPGIAYFHFAKRVSSDIDDLKKTVVDFASEHDFTTFKVDCRRPNKNYPMKSMDVNIILGSEINQKLSGKKVQMKNPDLMLRIELQKEDAYLSAGGVRGVGGLPTDQQQKVVLLLSGGLDSPVAGYMMMKRGCEVILTHYKNDNQMSGAVQDKIEQLAKQLSRYQVRTKLYVIPFEELQKEIIMNVKASERMLVYRKVMLNLSSRIADEHKALFLVTGDNFSQVASQTYENLAATYADCPKHIFAPLMGLDKNEVIAISKEIETYDISSLPYGDCCSFFLPKHPQLKATSDMLRNHINSFDLDELGKKAIEEAEIITY